MRIFDFMLLGNTLWDWVLALLIGLVTFAALRLLLLLVRGRLAVLAARTAFKWDEIIVHALGKTNALVIPIVALAAALTFLAVPARLAAAVRVLLVLALLFQLGLWLTAGFGNWMERYTVQKLTGDQAAATTVSALSFLVKLVLWSVILLVALDNLGINITALVAGLGVGGIAIALAVQNVLGDLFASLSIVLDKPFVLGDFIIVDEHMGVVEHIGLKTTRVRSLWGEQLVFSNADLLQSRLRNFGRMGERRVVFPIGVTYQTPHTKLEQIPRIIREAIEEHPKTRFDRSHFKAYGDFALTFESVYYVLSREFNVYMDIQQAINLRLHERFEQEGIEFAYPTQTLFLKQETN